jgi:excisionase family DNA binding protein
MATEHNSQQPALLTRKQAAAWLSISERHLTDLTSSGRIAAIRIGKKAVRYAMSDLQAFTQSCRA